MQINALGSGVSQGLFSQEMRRGGEARRQPPPPPKELEGLDVSAADFAGKAADNILKAMDADGDGQLSSSESTLPEDMFKKLDASGKGTLTREDLVLGMKAAQTQIQAHMQAGGQKPPPPKELEGLDPTASDFADKAADSVLKSMDADGDGQVSEAESGLPEDLFAKFDVDGKGSLSKEDLVSGFKTMQSEMQSRMENETGGKTGASSTDQNFGRGIAAYRKQAASVYGGDFGLAGQETFDILGLSATYGAFAAQA